MSDATHRRHQGLPSLSQREQAPDAIPETRVRYLFITHPFATICRTEVQQTVRLACLSHAASVRSEPGSNSSIFYSFNAARLPAPRIVRIDWHPSTSREVPTQTLVCKRECSSSPVVKRPENTPKVPRFPFPDLDETWDLWINRHNCSRACDPTFSRRSLFTCQRAIRTGRRCSLTQPSA